VGSLPQGIAITPNGLYVYVTNNDKTVSVINTTSNAVIATVNLASVSDPNFVAITPNGLYTYVAGYEGIAVIETTNNTVLTTIGVGNPPSGITINPDGLYAYVANSRNNSISVINTTSNAVIATSNFNGSFDLYGIAITPDKIPIPTKAPTTAPTPPTRAPTHTPTRSPTPPTNVPTSTPTIAPTRAPTSTPTHPPTGTPTNAPTKKEDIGLIVGLSCGGAVFITLLGVGGYLTHRCLKKKEAPPESNSLINPLSKQQQMVFL
jgi:YVTN family beta-propeller protein